MQHAGKPMKPLHLQLRTIELGENRFDGKNEKNFKSSLKQKKKPQPILFLLFGF